MNKLERMKTNREQKRDYKKRSERSQSTKHTNENTKRVDLSFVWPRSDHEKIKRKT